MMLVCINNIKRYRNLSLIEVDKEIPLTVGKIYETNGGPPAQYSVICDDGTRHNFSTSRFITLDEWREMKLNDLGI